MPTVTQDISRAIIVTAFLVSGLAIDQYVPFWGQLLVSIAAWTLLLYWISVAPREQQVMLYTCVAYATLGECFLSLVWGLYDYRLGNIPAFVPPGHALLLVLGLIITARTPDWVTWVVPGVALPCVALLAWIGVDTFGVLLFSLIALCMVFNRSRKLYAVMFVLSLTMEIYGTWIGNWAWRVDVPWIGLTTTNPPFAAGAFYCMLDWLVMTTLRTWRSRQRGAITHAA
jgi:hypothetical protein